MYEFTNGIVVFDEKTRDRYIEAGYRLVATGGIVSKKNMFKPEEIGELCVLPKEVLNENTSNNGTIKRQPKKCNKLSK